MLLLLLCTRCVLAHAVRLDIDEVALLTLHSSIIFILDHHSLALVCAAEVHRAVEPYGSGMRLTDATFGQGPLRLLVIYRFDRTQVLRLIADNVSGSPNRLYRATFLFSALLHLNF